MTALDPALAARLAELLQAAFDAGGVEAMGAIREEVDRFVASQAASIAAASEPPGESLITLAVSSRICRERSSRKAFRARPCQCVSAGSELI